jgi:hypothetical protein
MIIYVVTVFIDTKFVNIVEAFSTRELAEKNVEYRSKMYELPANYFTISAIHLSNQ